jgi:hypothetical protein
MWTGYARTSEFKKTSMIPNGCGLLSRTHQPGNGGQARGRGEMADAAGLGPVGGNTVGVQVPSPAPGCAPDGKRRHRIGRGTPVVSSGGTTPRTPRGPRATPRSQEPRSGRRAAARNRVAAASCELRLPPQAPRGAVCPYGPRPQVHSAAATIRPGRRGRRRRNSAGAILLLITARKRGDVAVRLLLEWGGHLKGRRSHWARREHWGCRGHWGRLEGLAGLRGW